MTIEEVMHVLEIKEVIEDKKSRLRMEIDIERCKQKYFFIEACKHIKEIYNTTAYPDFPDREEPLPDGDEIISLNFKISRDKKYALFRGLEYLTYYFVPLKLFDSNISCSEYSRIIRELDCMHKLHVEKDNLDYNIRCQSDIVKQLEITKQNIDKNKKKIEELEKKVDIKTYEEYQKDYEEVRNDQE